MDENDVIFEEVVVENLADVREQKFVIPATRNVKVMIKKAENRANQTNTYRWIGLQLQIVDGIDDEGKYKNKVVFGSACYYADSEAYTKDFFKNRQHLIQLKNLCGAVGDTEGKITADFIDSLQGVQILADIVVKKDQNGDPDNDVRNFKPLPEDSLV